MNSLRSLSWPPNEDRHGGILATCILDTVLAVIVVALRMVTRVRVVRNLGWDDYTILCAIVGHLIGLGLVVAQVHYGFGRHRAYLSQREYTEFLKFSYGEWIQTFQTLMFTKISICCLLLRIPVQRYILRPLQGAIVFLVVTNIILTFLWCFQCHPVRGAWDKQSPASCFTDAQLLRIIISQAIISIISDVVFALSPLVLLWSVQIELRVKAGLCVLMGLGVITAALCVVRTVLNGQNVTSDQTWTSVVNWQWRSWEVCIGIIAASIPTLRPGYRTLKSNINTYISRRSSHKPSTDALNAFGHPSKSASTLPASSFTKRLLSRPAPSYDPSSQNVEHIDLIEAGQGRTYKAALDGFAMQYLPSDEETMHQGNRKTTTIDVHDRSAAGSQKSLNSEHADRGHGSTSIV